MWKRWRKSWHWKSAEAPSRTVLSVTAAIFIWKEDGGKVHWMNIKKIYVLFSKKNSFLYKTFWKLPLVIEKMKITGSAFVSDKAARCGATFFCAIFFNHRWRIIWPNLCDWPKFENLKLHIHLQFTHPKELIFWNNKRYFMAIFLSHLK